MSAITRRGTGSARALSPHTAQRWVPAGGTNLAVRATVNLFLLKGTRMKIRQAAFLVLSLGVVSVGCGSSNQEANSPDEFSAEADMQASADVDNTMPAADTGAANDNATRVTVDQTLVEQCGLKEAQLYFPYDSADVKGNGDDRVRAMADCLTSGNLKGKQLQLVGHADPRGTEEYNKELGKSRAQTIADLLSAAGVPQDKLVVQSKGESAASDDQDNWPYDRRVEISVVSN